MENDTNDTLDFFALNYDPAADIAGDDDINAFIAAAYNAAQSNKERA